MGIGIWIRRVWENVCRGLRIYGVSVGAPEMTIRTFGIKFSVCDEFYVYGNNYDHSRWKKKKDFSFPTRFTDVTTEKRMNHYITA